MAKFELKLPKMGESVAEATVTNWLKSVGEKIEADEAVLEIATDKVDSEVPSEVAGVLTEILFQVNDVVKVGQTIAIIETEGGASTPAPVAEAKTESTSTPAVEEVIKTVEVAQAAVAPADFKSTDIFKPGKSFNAFATASIKIGVNVSFSPSRCSKAFLTRSLHFTMFVTSTSINDCTCAEVCTEATI